MNDTPNPPQPVGPPPTQPPYPNQQYPQAGYPQPVGFQQVTVSTTGIPEWMHVLYAIGGFFTCGVLWVVWLIHWWFVKLKSTAVTTGYQIPPQQPYPPQPQQPYPTQPQQPYPPPQ